MKFDLTRSGWRYINPKGGFKYDDNLNKSIITMHHFSNYYRLYGDVVPLNSFKDKRNISKYQQQIIAPKEFFQCEKTEPPKRK